MDVLSNQIDQFVSILYRSRHSNGSLKEKNKSLKKIDLAWSAYNRHQIHFSYEIKYGTRMHNGAKQNSQSTTLPVFSI